MLAQHPCMYSTTEMLVPGADASEELYNSRSDESYYKGTRESESPPQGGLPGIKQGK